MDQHFVRSLLMAKVISGLFPIQSFGSGEQVPVHAHQPPRLPLVYSGYLGFASGHAVAEITIDLALSALRAGPGDTINMYLWILDADTGVFQGVWPLGADFSDPSTYDPLTLSEAGGVEISGYVRESGGKGIGGVTMTGLPGAVVTGSDGYYRRVVPEGWSGTVTPEKFGFTFNPISRDIH